MANRPLTDHLQFHGQSAKTGCLHVKSEGRYGRVYMQLGHLVHAETHNGSGYFALFSALAWDNATVQWRADEPAPKISFEETVDSILVSFAQLEDAHQTSEEQLRSAFPDGGTTQNIQLNSLSSYQVILEVTSGDLRGKQYILNKKDVLIGRGEDCHWTLPDSTVSYHHCTVHQEPNCIRVIDLGSTNGTFVNEQLVSEALVRVDDALRLGQLHIKVSFKMQRHFGNAEQEAKDALSNAPRNVQEVKKSASIRIDPRMKKQTPSSKPAITWKTVEEDKNKTKTKTKTNMGDIISRMFNAKK